MDDPVDDGRSSSEVCVLLPVYVGTPAVHLERALHSIARQTLVPEMVLLIQDGELSKDHYSVIEAASRYLYGFRVERPGAVGLVGALNAGLFATEATWIARMDADDIAEPTRLARQLSALADADIDVLGSAMWEFEDDPDQPNALRSMPESHDDIVRMLRTMNPINHPTVVMRRSAVVAVDGYQRLAGLEDYFLWARMAASGSRFRNLPEPLLRYRVDDQSYQRRAHPAALKAEWTLQRQLRRLGLVGPLRSAFNVPARIVFRQLPPSLMRPAYGAVRSLLARRSSASS